MIARRPGVAAPMLCALALASACSNAVRRTQPPLGDQVSNGDRDARQALLSELQTEVLNSYERDEAPDLDTAVLPEVGTARIGVGPGDVLVDQELENTPSRWPLMIGADTRTVVRSKRLKIHLAKDLSAAWISDEVSWRIEVCGRSLAIPLRLTAMFARDGDRWVLALEHISTGIDLASVDARVSRLVRPAEVSAPLAAAVSASVAQALLVPVPDSPLLSVGSEAMLLGPGWTQEWEGPDLISQRLVDGTLAIVDDRASESPGLQRRIGAVGRTTANATVAYWVGNLVATTSTGVRQQLRGSFVLERRAGTWVVVQGHVSAAMTDAELARTTVGSALVSLNPLVTSCGDPAPAPEAAAK